MATQREQDERLLEMLHMRRIGIGAGETARRLGVSQQAVSRATAAVAQADTDATPAQHRAAYPWSAA
jgi:hypothetical protein